MSCLLYTCQRSNSMKPAHIVASDLKPTKISTIKYVLSIIWYVVFYCYREYSEVAHKLCTEQDCPCCKSITSLLYDRI